MGESIVIAQEPEHFASADWLSHQLYKRDDSSTEISYVIGDDDISTGPTNGRNPPKQPSRPAFEGGISFHGPASRVYDLGRKTKSPWTIVGCKDSPTLTKGQTVMAYCTSKNPKKDCAGLFVGGADNTLVTLPKSCGAPFGRIVKFEPTTVSKLPEAERIRVSRAKDVSVFIMKFDYNFKAIPKTAGRPDIGLTIDVKTFGFDPKKSASGKVSKKSNGKRQLAKRWDLGHDESVSINKAFKLQLAGLEAKCETFDLSLKAMAAGELKGKMAYGYYLSGTLWTIKEHRAYFQSEGSISASLALSGLAKYHFEGEVVSVLKMTGLPGFSVMGIVTVGPYVKADLKLSGAISVDGHLEVSTTVHLPSVDISVGDGSKPNAIRGTEIGSFNISENIDVAATLSVAMVPEFGLGIQVLQLVDAKVAVMPSIGLNANAELSISGSNSLSANSCVGLHGQLALGYGVTGKLGPWGVDKKDNFWDFNKPLFQKCFSYSKKGLVAPKKGEKSAVDWHTDEALWKSSFNKKLTCPTKRPFMG
ncbi:hypothetical protein EMPS_03972 [Entomortierella parvispora]|uniref:Uncharacterized protein n=1 Tax=Entomortierella parvispora TaxID=205924 RepID=A0A9P3H7T5_9FUNG|nr:hypothetical protein EMPS_03972 [Entomortierella parvispora]